MDNHEMVSISPTYLEGFSHFSEIHLHIAANVQGLQIA